MGSLLRWDWRKKWKENDLNYRAEGGESEGAWWEIHTCQQEEIGKSEINKQRIKGISWYLISIDKSKQSTESNDQLQTMEIFSNAI